jgi:hypothetical protein
MDCGITRKNLRIATFLIEIRICSFWNTKQKCSPLNSGVQEKTAYWLVGYIIRTCDITCMKWLSYSGFSWIRSFGSVTLPRSHRQWYHTRHISCPRFNPLKQGFSACLGVRALFEVQLSMKNVLLKGNYHSMIAIKGWGEGSQKPWNQPKVYIALRLLNSQK